MRKLILLLLCFVTMTAYAQTNDVAFLLSRAQAGDGQAQFDLSMCFLYGEGTTKDLSKAVHWLKESAKMKNAQALAEMAKTYRYGRYSFLQNGHNALYFALMAQEACSKEMNFTDITVKRNGGEVSKERYKFLGTLLKDIDGMIRELKAQGYSTDKADVKHALDTDSPYRHVTEGRCAHIDKVTTEFDVFSNGVKGMNFVVDIHVTGMQYKLCRCLVHLFNKDGSPFINMGAASSYSTAKGHVFASVTFRPKHETSVYTGLRVFVPYAALRINGAVRADAKGQVSLYDCDDLMWIDDGTLQSSDFHVTW
jgi:hypothetical protein